MKRDGYRYVRSYLTSKGERWALWEVVSGRSTRVGTALTENGYRLFLGVPTVPRYRTTGLLQASATPRKG